MSSKIVAPAPRLGGAERRELVLDAATRAFAGGGYAGTSTDAVARAAGVSQPYVVRIFGTKLELYLQVYRRACDRIGDTFQQVIAAGPFDPDDEAAWGRLGEAYTALVADRDLLLVMMHGFAAGSVPEIGTAARQGMAHIAGILQGTGGSTERIRDFLAQGMLLNVLLAMRAPEHLASGGPLATITTCAFGGTLPAV
ncbi:MAG: TetR/AcrR family transcriptional regulator [Actinomycetota bacterium]|nr:TetR/AcrR family transcriptional regulator [Actinomycetota bacterium]